MSERLAEILTAIRSASDPRYRNDLVDKAFIELARHDGAIHAARAAAVRVLTRGQEADKGTLRLVQGWAAHYGSSNAEADRR